MNHTWQWRRNYRVWDANRKVFLHPENWIEPELRPSAQTRVELREVGTVAQTQRTCLLVTSTTPEVTLVVSGALAADLGRDLYRVDLGGIVTKYIGETEKNLDRVFGAAENTRAVLFFDEADAIFGKRSEVRDSDSPPIAYLLKQIEAYEGVAILATRSTRKAVEPLARRFPFVIDRPTVAPGDVRLVARKVDITTLDVDAIVNAANESLAPGGGVCGAIHRAAGSALARACAQVAPCPTGEARITPGFNLPARFVIHAVGPVWRGGAAGEAELLASAYRASMVLARKHGVASIAFPAISTGIYGYPLADATTIAVATVRAELAAPVTRVVFACFSDDALAAYLAAGAHRG